MREARVTSVTTGSVAPECVPSPGHGDHGADHGDDGVEACEDTSAGGAERERAVARPSEGGGRGAGRTRAGRIPRAQVPRRRRQRPREAITVLSKAQRSIHKLPRSIIRNNEYPLLRIIDLVIIRNNGLFAASESEAANHERAPPAERRL